MALPMGGPGALAFQSGGGSALGIGGALLRVLIVRLTLRAAIRERVIMIRLKAGPSTVDRLLDPFPLGQIVHVIFIHLYICTYQLVPTVTTYM